MAGTAQSVQWLQAVRSGVWFLVGARDLLYSNTFLSVLDPTQISVKSRPRVVSLGSNAVRTWCWPLLSCAEVKNEWSYTSARLVCHHVVHRDKLWNCQRIRLDSKLQPTRCNVSWFIYFYRRCTCFRRFLHPSSSSGAHNCTYSFRYCQPSNPWKQQAAVLVDNFWSCICSYVPLIMGGGTAW